ncbi:GNAT family N-acetyltransferase [Chondromyces apiculatus]|uniref:Acetyltransferase, GNAT family n=1 Tax=Chondromyces apiculatus DSM 436 TaxID=1192034 RepID=A0A017SUC9_9BACT|nr:GNAT family N-acetyltransferase [Chondromyces apiculatus]EYF00568.1 acetyltransferase, GNAT family [Chondromyces apiculatus DSM 436]
MDAERTPPDRIRISRLQEAQLPALTEVEKTSAAMYQNLGADASAWKPRTAADIAALTKDHDVLVAEADHQVAGYLAWRDEAPGVARITQLAVHPDYQRFGVASRLLEALQESAGSHGLSHVVGHLQERAPWAAAFCRHAGLERAGEIVPEAVQRWREAQHTGDSGALSSPPAAGALVWMPIAHAPEPPDDEDDDSDESEADGSLVDDDAPTPQHGSRD